MSKVKFEINSAFATTANNVMELLSNANQIQIWSGEPTVFEAKEGGAFSFLEGWVIGVVEKINERNLWLSWRVADWPETFENAKLFINCTDKEGYSELNMLFEKLPNEEVAQQQEYFWQEALLTPLEDYLAVKYP